MIVQRSCEESFRVGVTALSYVAAGLMAQTSISAAARAILGLYAHSAARPTSIGVSYLLSKYVSRNPECHVNKWIADHFVGFLSGYLAASALLWGLNRSSQELTTNELGAFMTASLLPLFLGECCLFAAFNNPPSPSEPASGEMGSVQISQVEAPVEEEILV